MRCGGSRPDSRAEASPPPPGVERGPRCRRSPRPDPSCHRQRATHHVSQQQPTVQVVGSGSECRWHTLPPPSRDRCCLRYLRMSTHYSSGDLRKRLKVRASVEHRRPVGMEGDARVRWAAAGSTPTRSWRWPWATRRQGSRQRTIRPGVAVGPRCLWDTPRPESPGPASVDTRWQDRAEPASRISISTMVSLATTLSHSLIRVTGSHVCQRVPYFEYSCSDPAWSR